MLPHVKSSSLEVIKIAIFIEYKNLRVIFDRHLRFMTQVAKVAEKAYFSLRNLYRSKDFHAWSLLRKLGESPKFASHVVSTSQMTKPIQLASKK